MRSSIAGIIDRGGGLRVVVTERWRMWCHVGMEEQLFVVPNQYVDEKDIKYDNWPTIVRIVELYIDWWIKTRNDPDFHPFVAKYIERLDTFKFKGLPGGSP